MKGHMGDARARRTSPTHPILPWRQNGTALRSVESRQPAQSCEVGVVPSEDADAAPLVGHRG
ncbi:hypothetical protein K435DRAFT_784545 [Dendrothele bispora CBS 962.96]|uniref:Uncharacterized protein n=1 Tax=Dendrothele bispora (strain CBS 962.96) TaxID=1314807 RepID=A0A4S8L2F7_DENBC|nr:hypothetical protein K435DRAFT_784545 [Dendrothele bispora CBS 962.96]